MKRYLTSESVTEGHPDKLCDQIADAILDAFIASDPNCRSAVEVCATTGFVLVMGEVSTAADFVDIDGITRGVIRNVGYNNACLGFDSGSCGVMTSIHSQSPDIAQGVNNALEIRAERDKHDIGAGDQGTVFGFACDETAEYMPATIVLAHKAARRLAEVRKSGELPWLRPDGKSQITIEYEDGKPVRVDTILISAQHDEDAPNIEQSIIEHVAKKVVPANLLDDKTRYLVNPTGRFVIGGPTGDTGLTGRKLIVDTYGGIAHHGGGSFSGKDATKVDRSAAYAARFVAKNIVAAGLAKRVEIAVSYAIGVAKPVAVHVDSFGTGILSDAEISKLISQKFDLRPSAIIERLNLRRPIYQPTAAYGHFGRIDIDAPWEELTLAAEFAR